MEAGAAVVATPPQVIRTPVLAALEAGAMAVATAVALEEARLNVLLSAVDCSVFFQLRQ